MCLKIFLSKRPSSASGFLERTHVLDPYINTGLLGKFIYNILGFSKYKVCLQSFLSQKYVLLARWILRWILGCYILIFRRILKRFQFGICLCSHSWSTWVFTWHIHKFDFSCSTFFVAISNFLKTVIMVLEII